MTSSPGQPPLYRRRGRSLTEKGGALADRITAAFSGLLLALCFPKFSLAWLSSIALVPLFVSLIRAPSPGRAFLRSFFSGWTFYSILLYWEIVMMRTGGVPLLVAVLGWFLKCVILASEWGLFGMLVFPVRRAGPLLWGAAWVLMEWLKAGVLSHFPWALVGYSVWEHPFLMQIASFGGVYAVSFVIVSVNAAFATSLYDFQAPAEEHWSVWRWPMVVLGLFLLAGAYRTSNFKPDTSKVTRVAILQPAIDQYKKWDEDYADEVRETLMSLASESARGVDLVVWPEAAVPGWIQEPREHRWLVEIASVTGASQLVGAPLHLDQKTYNAAILFDKDGAQRGTYFKQVLVPFGEFIPFERVLSPWIKVLNELGGFTAGGPEQAPIQAPFGLIGANICYEAAFPFVARRLSAQGAMLHANLTNDSWYLDTAGPYQHLMVSAMRAVENGTYWVRAANSGVSAIFDPLGRRVAELALDRKGVIVYDIPATGREIPTPYVRFGDWFVLVCFLFWLAVLIYAVLNMKRSVQPVDQLLFHMRE